MGRNREAAMSGYSIVILICSATLSHADCQLNTALDVVRGPKIDNQVMCGFNAQAMIARTALVQRDGSQYMKVLCSPTKTPDEWATEIKARMAAASSNLRPSLIDGRIHIAYFPGAEQIPQTSWPNIKNKSHTITAYVDGPGDGVLVAAGGIRGGYTLFVMDGKPTYEFNRIGQSRYRVTSSEALPSRKSTIRVEVPTRRRSTSGSIGARRLAISTPRRSTFLA
jgi:hypothetical protein